MADIKLNDASLTTITALNDTDLLNPVIAATGEIQKITIANVKASITGGVKIYAGTISQSGSSAPTINEAVNTTGKTFTTARTGTGAYSIIASGALFGVGLTVCLFTNSTATPVGASRSDTTHISVATTADSVLSICSFKIEVYP